MKKIMNWIRINITDAKINRYIKSVTAIIEKLLQYERDVEMLLKLFGKEDLIPEQVPKVKVLLADAIMEMNKGRTQEGRREIVTEIGAKILHLLDNGKMGNVEVYIGIIKRVINK